MLGSGTKIFAGLSLTLALYIAYDEIKIARLQLNLQISQDNEEDLKDALVEEKISIKTMQDIVVASVKRESDLKKDLVQSRKITTDQTNEINNLRMTENARALQAPFERGSAAALRLRNTWMRFEGQPSGDNISPSNTPSNNQ